MANETDTLRAVGHGILTLVNAAILVAILAVVLSPGGAAAVAIQQFFALLSWLVGLVVQPLTAGANVQLTATAAPASQVTLATATGGSSGTTTTQGQATSGTGGTTTTPAAGATNIASAPDASGQYPIYDNLGRIVGHSMSPGTATPE